MEPMLEEITKTTYKYVKRDTVEVPIPVQEVQKSKKSEEILARSAADFIRKIKILRFDLASGSYEAFPEGRSLEASIKELYAVENRYMELFLGKTVDTTYKYIFYVTPAGTTVKQPFSTVLCYLDNDEGIVIPRKLLIKRKGMEEIKFSVSLETKHPLTSPKINPAGPVYRIPALCDVVIQFKDTPLYRAKININQFGYVNQLPIEILQKNTNKIELDPETGNLKNIEIPLEINKKSK
jgi:hypothetical protein